MSNISWHIRGGRVLCPSPFGLMGIVNATPDSFSDGDIHTCSSSAILHSFRLLDEGACIVDIGGESTRPQSAPVSEFEEWERIEPIITGIVSQRPEAIISVDTKKSFVAKQALLAGAHCINDVSACLFDPLLLEVIGEMRPGYILMHNTGLAENVLPLESDAVLEHRLLTFFEKHIARLVRAGLPDSHIMLDPGIGFGTTPETVLQMLRLLPCLEKLGRPILVALSMKSFLGHFFDAPLSDRGRWTCLLTALLSQRGIVWHRVHDVDACSKALRFVNILGGRF